VTVDQRLEYVVCRADNALTVRPPASSFYASVDINTSGTAANVNFPAWNIFEVFQGCGEFWKYGITGTATNLNLL